MAQLIGLSDFLQDEARLRCWRPSLGASLPALEQQSPWQCRAGMPPVLPENIFQPMQDESSEIAPVHLWPVAGLDSEAGRDAPPDRCTDLGLADAQLAFNAPYCEQIRDRRSVEMTVLDMVFEAHQLEHDDDVLALHVALSVRRPRAEDVYARCAKCVERRVVVCSQLNRPSPHPSSTARHRAPDEAPRNPPHVLVPPADYSLPSAASNGPIG